MIIRWNNENTLKHRAKYQSAGFVQVYFGKGLVEVILFSPTFSILGDGSTTNIFLNKGKTTIVLDHQDLTEFRIKKKD